MDWTGRLFHADGSEFFMADSPFISYYSSDQSEPMSQEDGFVEWLGFNTYGGFLGSSGSKPVCLYTGANIVFFFKSYRFEHVFS